ncbi:50S ribosomal protein L15 [Desulfovibrio ferrophilus]|uniref:Large ribosomal subunit protein uL15 n=1 Tax=Desulfovibrio ferrophilus TaxID=241368 RepID=A0A2Z6AVC6_9BACT|nr:50S ribosomal protein L15 [Desulfovibrio ferrophilus]BBD07136.1 50S ribosomal protein L15 [Desulfovibrio ferrophilus]
MRLHELYPFPEERKNRKRIGRGPASGQGGTSGKGHKGQNARSGGGVPAWFEGGQMPLARRLPKRGFKNPFRVTYETINVGTLVAAFEGKTEITVDDIYQRGLVSKNAPVKILGDGDVGAAVTVEAHRFSKSAADKIAAAGGTAKPLEG